MTAFTVISAVIGAGMAIGAAQKAKERANEIRGFIRTKGEYAQEQVLEQLPILQQQAKQEAGFFEQKANLGFEQAVADRTGVNMGMGRTGLAGYSGDMMSGVDNPLSALGIEYGLGIMGGAEKLRSQERDVEMGILQISQQAAQQGVNLPYSIEQYRNKRTPAVGEKAYTP